MHNDGIDGGVGIGRRRGTVGGADLGGRGQSGRLIDGLHDRVRIHQSTDLLVLTQGQQSSC